MFIALGAFAAPENLLDPVQLKYQAQLRQLDTMKPEAVEALRKKMILDYEFQLKRAKLDKKSDLIKDYEAKLNDLKAGKPFSITRGDPKKVPSLKTVIKKDKTEPAKKEKEEKPEPKPEKKLKFKDRLVGTKWTLSGTSILEFWKKGLVSLDGDSGRKTQYVIRDPKNRIVVVYIKEKELVMQIDRDFEGLTYYNEKFPDQKLKGKRAD